MTPPGYIDSLGRRQFLRSVAAIPALARFSHLFAAPSENHPQEAPYLALEKFIEPGHDEFPQEKGALQLRQALLTAFHSGKLALARSSKGFSPQPKSYRSIAADLRESVFDRSATDVLAGWRDWVASLGDVVRVQFYVLPGDLVRFEVASKQNGVLFYRVGAWRVVQENSEIIEFSPLEEHVASASHPWFHDVTAEVFSDAPALNEQLTRGVPYWRARLDPASGIDVYGSNGIAVGDIDGDGRDEIYVCQPGGLPNLLLKIDASGNASAMQKQWGVDLLDDTSCALFLDLRNSGHQDLVVLRSSGPVLFINEGGRCRLRTDAFRFETPPKGGFTGMASADFDRDGKLDLYLCCYVYFQSEAQYTYASPYHDARNGPPNFLFRNKLNRDGSGFLDDCTAETGMMENNDRFSFAPAWCDYNNDGWPDLYVANDFGKKNLYRNENGHFRDVAKEAGVEDTGPGMSASWFDYDGDGKPDLYVANMWTDAGQRVTRDPNFNPAKTDPEAYRAHTMGNSLFHNRGNGTFEDTTEQQNVAFGRWAWSSGGHDLDNDGNPEIYITAGMLTNVSKVDLDGFFWRQVVARSPTTAGASHAYENGWNAINQFLREEYSWNGHEPNVLHARRGNRYLDFSGVSGIDFADDSRAFAITDFDGDGRPDILLKSRLGPQVRVLQNNCAGSNLSIAFRLRGTTSNRDAIGARVEVDSQAKWLEAGSGFLSQHSKRILFGLGTQSIARHVRIKWPSGIVQELADLQAGHTYSITEGSAHVNSEPFREHHPLPARVAEGDNTLALNDTWFLEPVPLPTKQRGPGLFVVKEETAQYDIFRRYLFDWRASLEVPFALLLNPEGDAVKVYGAMPSAEQVQADLARFASNSKSLGLPFPGFYIKQPRRDFFKFGAAYLWAGYPELALPYLERVLAHTPGNSRVLVLVGQIHLQADRIDEAAKCFKNAANVSPDSVDALIGLGDIATRKDRQSEAATFYRKALALNPKSAEAANGLGLAMAKQGELNEARGYFEQAIAARRDYTEAINNLGVLYTQQGKINDAVAAFTYGIQVVPDEDILYLNLGRIYVKRGETEKARLTMRQLLDRKPDDATARRALQDLEGR